MAIKFEDAIKDPKLVSVLKAFMKGEHNDENYDFYLSKDNNEKIYTKFISPKSATQVNLGNAVQKPLDALAAAKKWKDMTPLIATAKKEVLQLMNRDTMARFSTSKEYYAVYPLPTPPDLGPTKAKIAPIEKDIAEGTTFITTATATVKAKGKPADKEEVNRMFQSMRMRHDKVHEAFTALLQKDKAFTKANFPTTFAKKEAFTKLCMDYRKLLGA